MSTEAQLLANRRNAQKSTGPRTHTGKSVVSQNAVKHGLLAQKPVLSTEDQAEFDIYRDQMLAELAPVTPVESMLAHRIIDLSWRLRRIELIQNQAIDALNQKNDSSPLSKLTQSLFPKNAQARQTDTPASAIDTSLGRMAVKDFSNSRVLDRLLMYERRLEHSLFKTLLESQRLRLLRELQHPETPVDQSEYQLSLGSM